MQGRIVSKFNLVLFSLLFTSCGGGSGGLPATPADDKTPPNIIETVPSSEEAGILPTDSIKITFNESLKSLSNYITNEQVVVYLINDTTGVRVEPAIQLDETLFYLETKNTKNDVLIIPFINTNDLKISSQYQVAIKGIKDLSDNVMLGNCSWDFTTGENGLVTKKITLGKAGLCGTQPKTNASKQTESVQAFSINESTVLVNWTVPKTETRVDYYKIERVIGKQSSFEVLSQLTSELSYLDTKAEQGSKHTYKITAGNSQIGFNNLSSLSNSVIPTNGMKTIKPTQILLPDSSANNPSFFETIFTFSPNGTTLAMASLYADTSNPVIPQAGTVKLYNKTASGWIYTTTIISNTPKQNGKFGAHLTFSPDGTLLIVQERFADISNGINIKDAGSVQIFSKTKNGWSHASTLISSLPKSRNKFGEVIEFSPDSKTIAVGEPRGDDKNYTNSNFGTVQLFTKNSDYDWSRLSTIYSSRPLTSTEALTTFGYAIKFNSTGTTLAIGDRYGVVTPDTGNSGAVQLFSKTVDGWFSNKTLTSNQPSSDRFGSNLTFSPDGSTLAIVEYSNVAGGTIHFFDETTVDSWSYSSILYTKKLNFLGRLDWYYFAFSSDNSTLAISTYELIDINGVQTAISDVTLYRKSFNVWQYETTLTSNSPAPSNKFGINFKFSPNNAMLAIVEPAGDINSKTIINDVGTVQLFYRTVDGWQYTTTLISNIPSPDNGFGSSLEFSSDSTTLVISEKGVINIFDLTKLIK